MSGDLREADDGEENEPLIVDLEEYELDQATEEEDGSEVVPEEHILDVQIIYL